MGQSSTEAYTSPYVKQRASGNLLYDAGNPKQCSVITQRGEMGRGFKKEGTYVYLWLIHADVWQKSSQYCKVIIFQLKIKLNLKKRIIFQDFPGGQWLRICLLMQGTQVLFLVWEDSTCLGAIKPRAPQLLSPQSRAHKPQLLSPHALEPVLHNKRSHHYEKPVHGNQRAAPACCNQRKSTCSKKDPAQP